MASSPTPATGLLGMLSSVLPALLQSQLYVTLVKRLPIAKVFPAFLLSNLTILVTLLSVIILYRLNTILQLAGLVVVYIFILTLARLFLWEEPLLGVDVLVTELATGNGIDGAQIRVLGSKSEDVNSTADGGLARVYLSYRGNTVRLRVSNQPDYEAVTEEKNFDKLVQDPLIKIALRKLDNPE